MLSADFRLRDAKAIKRFIESIATYKSSRYCALKGEAYDAGNRLANHGGYDRPMTPAALASLAALEGVHVDLDARLRKLRARAAREEARYGGSFSLYDIGRR